MWTKRQIVEEAYSELALAGYVFDLSPEELQTALRRLDAMMATWEAKGVRVGYAFASGPTTVSLDTPAGLPDSAVETIFLNLAMRLAPGNGKQISPETKRAARDGYDTLLLAAAQPQEQQQPSTMPRGAGNRVWRGSQSPYYPAPDSNPLGITPGDDLSILPE